MTHCYRCRVDLQPGHTSRITLTLREFAVWGDPLLTADGDTMDLCPPCVHVVVMAVRAALLDAV